MDAQRPAFQFYEIVRVRPSYRGEDEEPTVIGAEGAIFGIGEIRETDQDGAPGTAAHPAEAGAVRWGYDVFLLDRERVWCFDEDDLEPTGRFERRETFFDGTVVRVQVDPTTGAGHVVEIRPGPDRPTGVPPP